MSRRLILSAIFVAILPAGWLVWSSFSPAGQPAIRSQLIVGEQDISGFKRATQIQAFNFPRDHGPHPEYQTEWWYYIGNLASPEGRRFGYQLTFFRRALAPSPATQTRPSTWATNQVYFAHFAVTDIATQSHQAFERFARGAANLAGARASPTFSVWLEDWKAEQISSDEYLIRAREGEHFIELALTDLKGPVLQGQQGLSQKGREPGNASYYYSLTALESQGTIEIDGKPFAVRGKSWMDHEYSTRALAPDQVGWDWFSVQLEDNTELMLFEIRQADGDIAQASSGLYIGEDGSTTPLTRDSFEIEVLETWRSPRSGATYPARWSLSIPGLALELDIEPFTADQELNLSFTYWEGAVRIRGNSRGKPIEGAGYVELTGYSESMAGNF